MSDQAKEISENDYLQHAAEIRDLFQMVLH